jgi:hypothetical protein
MASSRSGLMSVRVGDLDVSPAAEAAVVVHGRAPRVPGRRGLDLHRTGGVPGLLAAGDLDDEHAVELLALGSLEPQQEVGDVVVGAALMDVGDGEAEVVVLGVGRDSLGSCSQRSIISCSHVLPPTPSRTTWLISLRSSAGWDASCGS